ncbi:hypothetical protein C486_15209 [Natrinema gari JCM 14663]|uniref:Uncharacterized protein n=1 Tax=Natrinema gari JCM 14663 TaxID=1230459 RepID=L9YTK1_9EURY|nr:hypothetical protein C486_15209 [Natrinema gari JCM 14663]
MAAFSTRSRERAWASRSRSRPPGDRSAPRPRGVRRYRNRAPSDSIERYDGTSFYDSAPSDGATVAVEPPAVPEATTPFGATVPTDVDYQTHE